MWGVGCGMWDVGCGMWDIECAMRDGCGSNAHLMATNTPYTHSTLHCALHAFHAPLRSLSPLPTPTAPSAPYQSPAASRQSFVCCEWDSHEWDPRRSGIAAPLEHKSTQSFVAISQGASCGGGGFGSHSTDLTVTEAGLEPT
jgi:hypothetical protein